MTDAALLAHISAVYAEHRGAYGWPRIWRALVKRGIGVGKQRVQRLMQKHDIRARGKQRFRVPYWSPSAELRRRAEAKAIAVSMFQPEGITNKFFVEAPQKIFAHLLTFLPTPDELVTWMSNEEEIDKRVRRTEYWALIDKRAPLSAQAFLAR